MEEIEQGRRLYLNAVKDDQVQLFFDEMGYLNTIRLKNNKIAELFENQTLNKQTIFQVSEVVLITRANYKTLVRVVDNRRFIIGNSSGKNIEIDVQKTKNKNSVRGGYFDFIVAENQKIKHKDLHQRPYFKKNKKA